MDPLLTIGDFAKMTFLSVKALRHYHDVGLLEPFVIDGTTNYRRYAASQVAMAQAIRRFRDLDMPLDDVREVLQAPEGIERNRVILRHLERMQQQLERTQQSVASLQDLLMSGPPTGATFELRRIAALPVWSSVRVIRDNDTAEWLTNTLTSLRAEIMAAGFTPNGPDGAVYSDAFFEDGEGEVTAFVPATGSDSVLPAATFAVLTHDGPFSTLDQAYGALGTAVAERGIGGPGPIREIYHHPTSTEVCWPITQETTP